MWGMRLSISSQHAVEISKWAEQSHPMECCGLLLGSKNTVDHIVLAKNVADCPERRFEIDPVILIEWEKQGRMGAPQIIGYFHSHPNGSAIPSPTDANLADGDGRYWIITAKKDLTAWQAVRNGEIYGRFLPVKLNIFNRS